jgi:hypothetical protein
MYELVFDQPAPPTFWKDGDHLDITGSSSSSGNGNSNKGGSSNTSSSSSSVRKRQRENDSFDDFPELKAVIESDVNEIEVRHGVNSNLLFQDENEKVVMKYHSSCNSVIGIRVNPRILFQTLQLQLVDLLDIPFDRMYFFVKSDYNAPRLSGNLTIVWI